MEAELRAAIQDVVQSLRRDYESALAQEESLTLRPEPAEGEAQSMNRKAIDYAVLQRDVESSKECTTALLQRWRAGRGDRRPRPQQRPHRRPGRLT